MSQLLFPLLALLTVASALAAAFARRTALSGLALGINMLSLAGICSTLSARLVAAALALVGAGTLVASLAFLGRDQAIYEEANRIEGDSSTPPRGVALLLGLVVLISLVSTLLASDTPAWLGRSASSLVEGEQTTTSLLKALYTHYGLGLVGVGLVALVALIGCGFGEGER